MAEMNTLSFASRDQSGFMLLEALVTIVILAFGLLGLAGLLTQVQVHESESYQRAQAILLVQDMANRISANRANAAAYVTGTASPLVGNPGADCTGLSGASLDQCEWKIALGGAAEKQGGSSIGGMLGARGCIEALGTTPPSYRVSVAWQGMMGLKRPSLGCGANQYGSNDAYRRVITAVVTVANLN